MTTSPFVPPPPVDDLTPPPPLSTTADGDSAGIVESSALASHADIVASTAAHSKFGVGLSRNSTSIHAFSSAERSAFVKHINRVLGSDLDLQDKLPLDPDSDDIFTHVRDGILLCKLINASVPGTIKEELLIKKFRDEKRKTHHVIVNQNLCINGAKNIGAVIVNLGAEDLIEGKPYLVFGLIWQIIKIGALKEVTLEHLPELADDYDSDEDLADLPPEELLLKWFNWHLHKSGVDQVESFSSLTDSKAYIHLMHRLNPQLCSLDALDEPDEMKRAELMLADAEKLGCASFVTPSDIVQGNEKLNLVFAANMFNKHIGTTPITEQMEKENNNLQSENTELKDKVKQLESAVVELQASRSQLEQNLISALEQNLVKSELVSKVQKERDQVVQKLEVITEHNMKLVDEVHTLDENKMAAEKSLESVRASYVEVKKELDSTAEELQRERISLETSEFCGASLANDLESLRSRQEKLEYLIEHLKIERMRSDLHVERLRILYNSFGSTEALCEAIYSDVTLANIAKGSTKAGYLTKKARNGNSWKYRYFVLRDNFLFYFKSDKEETARFNGVIRVDDALIKFAENPTRRDLKDQWLLAIEVPNNNDQIKQHSFYISGEDHELEGWKTQIKAAAGWWTKRSRVKYGN